MARFSIAFDQADAVLGQYFDLSKQDIVNFINQNVNHQVDEIPSHLCSRAYIDITFPTANPKSFLFLAYSHGQKDRLISTQGSYIQVSINTDRFANSLFYSMSCHTGTDLGSDLLIQNCLGFIGYNDAAWVLDKYPNVSISCDNFGLKEFIMGATLADSFLAMKTNFTNNIDLLEAAGDPVAASLLRLTRDALVIHTNNPGLIFNQF